MSNDEERPRAVVGVLIYRDNGDIFLVKSKRWSNKWLIPGGHIDFGEKMEDTAKREIKEETNLDISDIKFLDAEDGIFPPELNKKKHFIYLHFTARFAGGEVNLNDEAEEYKWVLPQDALKLDLVASVRGMIEEYIAERETPDAK